MARKTPFSGSQDEIKAVIDACWERNGLAGRKELAEAIGLSEGSIYGYINRCEIPDHVYQKLVLPTLPPRPITQQNKKSSPDLSEFSIDDLVNELRNRGFKVDLKSV